MGRKAAWLVGGAIVLAAAAVLTAPYLPAALGGPASYALVAGEGMEPTLAAGDLAVFRTGDSYEAGEVVAYDAGQGPAIARVVARRGAGYVLRQDAGEAPALPVATASISGSLEAVLPRAGGALSWLRDPVLAVPAAAALAGAAVLVVGGLRPRVSGGRRRGPAERLPRRWRRLVVPVRERLDVADVVIDVTSLAGLVAVARQSGRIVLEVDDVGGRTWLVNGDDAVYRFAPAGAAPARQTAAPVSSVVPAGAPDPLAPALGLPEPGMLTAR